MRAEVEEAYAFCEQMAREHYENFPVGSLLVPSSLRRHVWAIYAFARKADDFADEGEWSTEERIASLDKWEGRLEKAMEGRPDLPIFVALAETLRETSLPTDLLRDLLSAFRHDARNLGFEREADLIAYCSRSANPIGRMILHLYGYSDEHLLSLSDKICTGLQLVNFWQDLSVDIPRDRINIPRETMRSFSYTEKELQRGEINDNFQALCTYLIEWGERYLVDGKPLIGHIAERRLRSELRITVNGGLAIAEKTRELGVDIVRSRPKISRFEKLSLAVKALIGGLGGNDAV